MKLNKEQAEALEIMIDRIQSFHEAYETDGEGGHYADDTDSILSAAEKLAYTLGKVDKLYLG